MSSPVLLRRICLASAFFLVVVGVLGMVLSLASMTIQSTQDVIAGAAGFVAGSIFVGAGLVSLTLLAVQPDRVDSGKSSNFDRS